MCCLEVLCCISHSTFGRRPACFDHWTLTFQWVLCCKVVFACHKQHKTAMPKPAAYECVSVAAFLMCIYGSVATAHGNTPCMPCYMQQVGLESLLCGIRVTEPTRIWKGLQHLQSLTAHGTISYIPFCIFHSRCSTLKQCHVSDGLHGENSGVCLACLVVNKWRMSVSHLCLQSIPAGICMPSRLQPQLRLAPAAQTFAAHRVSVNLDML